MKCQGKVLDDKCRLQPCRRKAVTHRKDFRFGDTTKGEPSIVNVTVHLCRQCAQGWDERRAEARAEARSS